MSNMPKKRSNFNKSLGSAIRTVVSFVALICSLVSVMTYLGSRIVVLSLVQNDKSEVMNHDTYVSY